MKKLLLFLSFNFILIFCCKEDSVIIENSNKQISLTERDACGGITIKCILRNGETNPTFKLTDLSDNSYIKFQACTSSGTIQCPLNPQDYYSYTSINLNWFYDDPCDFKECMELDNEYLLEELFPPLFNCGEYVSISLVDITVSNPNLCCPEVVRCAPRCFATNYSDPSQSDPECPKITLTVEQY